MTSLSPSLPVPRAKAGAAWLSPVLGRVLSALLTLVVIAFLAYWGMTMASRAVAGLPADPLASAVEAVRLTVNHFLHHPATYVVHREHVPAWIHIGTLLRNSLALLIPAMALAVGLGVPLGMAAARRRSRRAASLVWLISIIGITVPAFMLAMFLWIINIEASKRFNLTPLPATGLGWDAHILLPAIVLAARPFAVLTQVTYVTITDLIGQDFVRTARGKGLKSRDVDRVHILRNAWIPILTSLSTSLRFALATLPVVEYFFVWPGIGLGMLEAITAGAMSMAVDMALVLGLIFVAVNAVLEVAYPILDPRLTEARTTTDRRDKLGTRRAIVEWFDRLRFEWWERREERRMAKAERDRARASPPEPPAAISRAELRGAPAEPLHARPVAPEVISSELRSLIDQVKSALRRDDRLAARALARRAVRLAPNSEAAWLTLAAVSDPRPAQAYATRALQINPDSVPARRALQWAGEQIPLHKPQPVVRASARPPRGAARPAGSTRGALSVPGGGAGTVRGWAHLKDPVLVLAIVLALGMVFLAAFGSRLTDTSPYVANGVMMIEGEIGVPPYRPSGTFPWGTDQIGRDMQALVLHGARQTLMLALLVVAARLIVGVLAGMVAGWWQGGRFDRLVMWTLSVWAAFPVTLFAMILILAIGIERGMPTFVIALCFVGWGEIAQYVRSEVIALRSKPFLEGARAVGVPPEGILRQHILPNLAPALLVVASLEMGAVLLLLAELGFLGIFLGGGYRVMIGEAGRMMPVVAHYSDVPEWAALLANIRQWWRSYPWLAWSPAIAFSIAILTFNLWGEALRRFLERSRVSPARWINRTSMLGLAIVFGGAIWIFNTTAPLGEYRSQAERFDLGRTQALIGELSSPMYEGRETGTLGARLAAERIALEMEDIGLFPGGELDDRKLESYLFDVPSPRLHLVAEPTAAFTDAEGARHDLVYREDFAELPLGTPPYAEFGEPSALGEHVIRGRVVGVVAGPPPEGSDAVPAPGSFGTLDSYGLRRMDLDDRILLIRESLIPHLPGGESAGILVVADDGEALQRRYLFPGGQFMRPGRSPIGPMLMIHPAVADQLLAASGSSLAELDQRAAELTTGEVFQTEPGLEMEFEIPVQIGPSLAEKYISVIGYIAGQGAEMDMDDDVILVSAFYDGLGTAPDGTLYPGANDNLSAVATMLELARVLKDGPYAPDKTIVFVAWAGGDRWGGFSVIDAMSAKVGFNLLNVEAVIELSGVGGGSGEAIAIGPGTSFRLSRLLEAAAGRVGVRTTTRGTDPHNGLPKPPGFGQRDALSAYLSWDGSDALAHTPGDNYAAIEPEKLQSFGETLSLFLTVLAREAQY